jgi:parvulin-like peptidyl-prolyl isomerase
MSRRAVTKPSGTEAGPLNRKQLTRRERETRQLRHVWIALIAVGALIVGVLGFGSYQEFIVKPNAPVAVVHGVPIRTSAYAQRVRYEQWLLQLQAAELQQQQARLDPQAEGQEFMAQYLRQQLQQIQASIPQVPYQTVQTMIDDELVRQEADRRGIAVTEEELQQAIEEQFGYQRVPPTPAPNPMFVTETLSIATLVPTPTPLTLEAFQKAYDDYIQVVKIQTDMSEAALREMLRGTLLRRKLQDALAAEVPTEAEQVHARHILVDTEEEAQQVREQLDNGESFELLAQELSKDDYNKDEGGDLGWFPRGQMVPEFEKAAFQAGVGDVVGPVQTSFGWHIIKVEGHEVRALEPSALELKQSQALEDWLAGAQLSEGIEDLWKPEMAPSTEAG